MSSSSNVDASSAFFDAVKGRRSVYHISSDTTIPDSRVIEIVQDAVKHAPSAFNSQNGRAVVLLGEHHKRLWDFVLDVVPQRAGAAGAEALAAKVRSFQAGHGSILFFEDDDVIAAMQQRAPVYKDYFPQWSAHSIGMVQYIIWTALEKEGLGASLQHFNPLIDAAVHKEFTIPTSWRLVAQMPFGKPVAAAGEKQFSSIEERVKVFA